MYKELDHTELKRIMRLYFTTIGRLLFWQRDEAMQKLEQQVLDLILAIMGKTEYKDACIETLRETAPLQTIVDCAMMKLGDCIIEKEQASFFDMKADMLKHYKIEENQVFDMDILVMDNRQAVIDGDPGALRLGACFSYLGLDSESSVEAAIRYWTVLAYTGDRFAMDALEYAYSQKQDARKSALWHTVKEIFREADSLFTITVPEHFLQEADMDAVNTAQVILAVRRCCADDDKELLPIPLLQYAIDSREDVATKLQNLYAPPETYHTMLARQSRREKKSMGFSI